MPYPVCLIKERVGVVLRTESEDVPKNVMLIMVSTVANLTSAYSFEDAYKAVEKLSIHTDSTPHQASHKFPLHHEGI